MTTTPGKLYFDFIAKLQRTMLYLSYAFIIILPILFAYVPTLATADVKSFLFDLSLFTAFLVMCIRPMADLMPKSPWVRPLVILRKGFGTFSAVIIVSFVFANVLVDGMSALTHYLTLPAWRLADGAFLGPVGDISAFILLITSNQFSKRLLGANWKRVQKLAYVYFAAGALYEFLLIGTTMALIYLVIAAGLGGAAFCVKRLPGYSLRPAV